MQGAMAGAERIFGTLALPSDGARPSTTGDGASVGHRSIVRRPRGLRLRRRTAGPARRLARGRGAASTWRWSGAPERARPARCTSWPASTDRGAETSGSRAAIRRGSDESERRRVLGVVPQTVQLFSGTVIGNLTLDDPSMPDAAVHEARRIAGADALHPGAAAGLSHEAERRAAPSAEHSSRPDSSSCSRWLARWCTGRPSCSSTKPRRPSIARATRPFERPCAPRCSLRGAGC